MSGLSAVVTGLRVRAPAFVGRFHPAGLIPGSSMPPRARRWERPATSRLFTTLLVTLSLTLPLAASAGPSAPQPWHVVGVLTEQGDKFCDAEGRVQWVNLHVQVGWVPLIADATTMKQLRASVGKVVVVTGQPQMFYGRAKVTHKGQCPVPQLRSDMVEGKNGIRIRRARRSAPFKALSATSVRTFTGLTAVHEPSGDVAITFRNDSGEAISNLQLVGHYFGCYGKPGSLTRRSQVVTLPVGQTLTHPFPALATDNGRDYALSSVQVLGTGSMRWFDLDVGVSALGVKRAGCQRKGGHATTGGVRSTTQAPRKPMYPWRDDVQEARTSVEGALDRGDVRRRLRRLRGAFRLCYQRFLQASDGQDGMPTRQGTQGALRIRLDVGGSGRVLNAELSFDKGFGNKLLDNCTESMLRRVTFPASSSGSTTVQQTLTYTWRKR